MGRMHQALWRFDSFKVKFWHEFEAKQIASNKKTFFCQKSSSDMSEIKSTNSTDIKLQRLYIVLCAVFLSNAILAEMIGVKIFSLETLLGTKPTQLHLPFDFVLDFNLSAGVVLWPMVFVTSDIINEYYGKSGVKWISYLTAILITYVFLAVFTTTQLPPAQFWLDVNKSPGHEDFDINFAFSSIFRQGLGIIVGSVTAFLIGQILDAHTFHWIKGMTGSKHIWLRATGSTLVSQFIDSFVVLGVAFYLLGNWSLSQVLAVGIINYIYKFSVAVLMTPLLYLVHHFLDGYLGLRK
jgi:uncharacterized integral membrane protein (TIGR00697 family)